MLNGHITVKMLKLKLQEKILKSPEDNSLLQGNPNKIVKRLPIRNNGGQKAEKYSVYRRKLSTNNPMSRKVIFQKWK